MANAHTPETGSTQREKVLDYVRKHPGCTVEDIVPVLCISKVRVAQYLVRLKHAKRAFSTHVKGDTRLRWTAPEGLEKRVVVSFRQRILSYVTEHPGCYSAKINLDTGIDMETVSRSLYSLRKAGLVIKESRSDSGAARWALPGAEMPDADDPPICTVKQAWEPLKIAPQGIFAALGI